MASIFTRIVNGEIPCYKIAEDENYLAFLDVSPLAKGHTLVIPKKETDYIFDIPSAEHQGLWSFAQTVAKAIGKAVPCRRVGVAVIGLEVPHAHIHLIPGQSCRRRLRRPGHRRGVRGEGRRQRQQCHRPAHGGSGRSNKNQFL